MSAWLDERHDGLFHRDRLCLPPVPHRLVGRPGRAAFRRPAAPRAVVYALSLAVYCTSWTYYGSVGLASAHGLDFLPIYIGPILVIGLGAPLVGRIANLARAQNLTTVADFVSARYGKSQAAAAVAALIALVGVRALRRAAAQGGRDDPADGRGVFRQRPADAGRAFDLGLPRDRAGARGLRHRLRHAAHQSEGAPERPHPCDRRRVDRQARRVSGGRRLRGVGSQRRHWRPDRRRRNRIRGSPRSSRRGRIRRVWGVTTLLSAFAIILLPRQFHVAIVENHDQRDMRTASWLFPLYLVADQPLRRRRSRSPG